VVVQETGSGTLFFVRDDGVVLGNHSFADGVSPYDVSAAAAGRFWYIARSSGHLHSLSTDGSDTDVAALPDVRGGQAKGLAVSPDGRQWAWGVLLGGSVGPWHTHVELGGIGLGTRTALDESASNPAVLSPVAWTERGILVSRDATGIGGCCYLTPESGARDAMLMDPVTLHLITAWNGCATASASPAGSVACSGPNRTATIVVHRAAAPDVTLSALPPHQQVGWAFVDDAGNRAIFGVIHSFGSGGAQGPYAIDAEAGDLGSLAVSKLFDQVTPDAALPDGSVIVTSAPPVVNASPSTVSVRSVSGAVHQLGPSGAAFVAVFQLAS
jgi:hypothetical protein